MSKYQNTFPIRRKYKFGILKKQFFNEETNITSLTPKERKIKELYPKFNPNEIQQILRSNNVSKNEETLTPINKRYSENEIKRLKLDNIYRSNIFPNETSNYYNHKSTNTQLNSKDKSSFIPSNMDWKTSNTELFFIDHNKERGNKKNMYNPAEMKQKELNSHFNTKGTENHNYEMPRKKENFKENQIAEISQNYSKQFNKFKENISSMHSKDFYKNASKGKLLCLLIADRDSIKIIPFEIENIKNITEFNVKDIKSLISKNGYILVT